MGWFAWFSPHQSKNDKISTKGIPVSLERFPAQTPLDAHLCFEAQPRFDAPGDLQVEIVRKRSD